MRREPVAAPISVGGGGPRYHLARDHTGLRPSPGVSFLCNAEAVPVDLVRGVGSLASATLAQSCYLFERNRGNWRLVVCASLVSDGANGRSCARPRSGAD